MIGSQGYNPYNSRLYLQRNASKMATLHHRHRTLSLGILIPLKATKSRLKKTFTVADCQATNLSFDESQHIHPTLLAIREI